jgi:hypothetical protein
MHDLRNGKTMLVAKIKKLIVFAWNSSWEKLPRKKIFLTPGNDFLGTIGQICKGVYIWTGARISSLFFSSPFSSPAPAILYRKRDQLAVWREGDRVDGARMTLERL